MRKWSTEEVIKMIDSMVGSTEPVADSALDKDIEDNLMVLIDVVNWSLGVICDAARHRKSAYESQRRVGERAYSAMLEWGDWLKEAEDELA